MRPILVAMCAALFITSGCESTHPISGSQLENSEVSISELFAPPSSAELSIISDNWLQRDLTPRDIEEVYKEVLPDGRLLRVVSHSGTAGTHFGAIISPAEGTPVPADGFPIGLSLEGFGPPFVTNVNIGRRSSDSESTPVITLTPGFRGNRLNVKDQSFESEGPLWDHCDGATDDILAFLNVAFEVTPGAGERIVAVGGSRGGNTAMLASIRDDRIKRVVSIAGPDTYLQANYVDMLNLRLSYRNWFIKDLVNSPQSIAEARTRMISCSPLYFVQGLAPAQLHHGTIDINVPFETLGRMQQAWISNSRDPVELETYAYEGADHSLSGLHERIQDRIDAFILPVIQ